MISNKVLSVEETAELLNVNLVTTYRYIRSGVLKAEKKGRSYSVKLADLISYINYKNGAPSRKKEVVMPIRKAKPFLKWAGGKRQMADYLAKWIPLNMGTYHEPFLGGGALFFHLQPEKACLSDTNADLINVYKVVRDRVEDLIDSLSVHKNTEDYYYEMRSVVPEKLDIIKRASRTIYLNKTCFNGLYRVNKRGEFNVPFGKKTGEFTIDAENLRLASLALQNAEIHTKDYKDALKNVRSKDFVFLDPPYYPLGGFSDFQRYTKECFDESDHNELFDQFQKLARRGIKVMQSNSNADYIQKKYSEFPIEVIKTRRLISSKASTRSGEDVVIFSPSLYAN